jgi:hypothetical protein
MAFETYNSWMKEMLTSGVNWLKTPIHCAILSNEYEHDQTHRTFAQVAPYEVSGKGYAQGGVRLRGMSARDDMGTTTFSADPVKFTGMSWNNARFGVVHAVTEDNPLIGCFDLQDVEALTADAEENSPFLTGISGNDNVAVGFDVRGPGTKCGTIVVKVEEDRIVLNEKLSRSSKKATFVFSPLVSIRGGTYQVTWHEKGIFTATRAK